MRGKNVSKKYYIGGKTLLVYKLIAEGFHCSVKFMLYLTNFLFKIIASARLIFLFYETLFVLAWLSGLVTLHHGQISARLQAITLSSGFLTRRSFDFISLALYLLLRQIALFMSYNIEASH